MWFDRVFLSTSTSLKIALLKDEFAEILCGSYASIKFVRKRCF